MKVFKKHFGIAWIFSYLLFLLYGVGLISKFIVIDGKTYSDKWLCGMLVLVIVVGVPGAILLAGMIEKLWKKIENSCNPEKFGGEPGKPERLLEI